MAKKWKGFFKGHRQKFYKGQVVYWKSHGYYQIESCFRGGNQCDGPNEEGNCYLLRSPEDYGFESARESELRVLKMHEVKGRDIMCVCGRNR